MQGITRELTDRLKKDGYNLKSLLGMGTAGQAWDMGSNKVLKITKDPQEAKSMSVIKNKPNKYIVKVYKVWKYQSIPEFYMIEQDKLEPIDEWRVANLLMDYGEEIAELANGKSVKSYKEYADFVLFLVDKQVLKNEEGNMLLQLYKAAEHLKKVGIKFDDLHSGNIMKKGNIYKLIDLGFSKSVGGKVDIVEMKLRPLMENNVQKRIIDFFRKNPTPEDDQIHSLASELGINKHKFEEEVYKLLGSLIKR